MMIQGKFYSNCGELLFNPFPPTNKEDSIWHSNIERSNYPTSVYSHNHSHTWTWHSNVTKLQGIKWLLEYNHWNLTLQHLAKFPFYTKHEIRIKTHLLPNLSYPLGHCQLVIQIWCYQQHCLCYPGGCLLCHITPAKLIYCIVSYLFMIYLMMLSVA